MHFKLAEAFLFSYTGLRFRHKNKASGSARLLAGLEPSIFMWHHEENGLTFSKGDAMKLLYGEGERSLFKLDNAAK